LRQATETSEESTGKGNHLVVSMQADSAPLSGIPTARHATRINARTYRGGNQHVECVAISPDAQAISNACARAGVRAGKRRFPEMKAAMDTVFQHDYRRLLTLEFRYTWRAPAAPPLLSRVVACPSVAPQSRP
jgi:hypothetical protein